MPETVGIVLAAGSSRRMGENKMFLTLGGKTVLERSLEAFRKSGCFSRVIITCRKDDMEQAGKIASEVLDIPYLLVEGGAERQASVYNALVAAKGADVVAVHDGARCFIDPEVIVKCVEKAYETGSAAAGVRTKDTVKTFDGDYITGTIDREGLVNIQTPQVFGYELIMAAHKKAEKDGFVGTDECSLLERMGILISFVEASYDNIKITTPEDIMYGKALAGEQARTGIGYDAHRLEAGLPLILGGVNIPHKKGLLGHSDADVLIHAIIDALLGAAAASDIGRHFPMTNEFKGISGIELLKRTRKIIEDKGFRVVNIDSTVVMQAPKLAPYIDLMRENISGTLSISIDAISVKAKTTEGMGFEGTEEGVSATAVATLVG
jgi:2-C-methyl-D-erythritol 4-phosphate cytidylyltransferase / 2-C-methyl-D-erythritol 2,4-cyclodiphosphate synthase